MSEIDDIFASKGKPKATPIPPAPVSKKKKAKRTKRHANVAPDRQDSPEKPAPKKRPIPETIVDPSVQPKAQKRRKAGSETAKTAPKHAKVSKVKKEGNQFKDPPGMGPRQKTDEGWNIYKEDELGLTSGGGDTPLCPFDCDCCF